MSHPFKAQPYYFPYTGRARQPYPEPYGGFGGSGRGYTSGVFSSKIGYATPRYILDEEPTAVHGYGLGENAPGCQTPESVANSIIEAAKFVWDKIDWGSAASSATSILPDSWGAKVVEAASKWQPPFPAEDALRAKLIAGLYQASQSWQSGRSAVISWVAKKIAEGVGVNGAAGLLASALDALASATFDKLININICQPGVTMYASEMLTADPNALSTTQMSLIQAFGLRQPVYQMRTIATGGKATALPEEGAAAPAATAPAAAGGGTSSAVLLGGAALLALLFLR